jgi:hypothetical protein
VIVYCALLFVITFEQPAQLVVSERHAAELLHRGSAEDELVHRIKTQQLT